MRNDITLDPIYFSGGSILLLPDGKCIVQLDPLDKDASDVARDYVNKYLAALADLGHVGYCGTVSQYALVREATRDAEKL